MKRFTAMEAIGGDTRAADRIAAGVTDMRGRADGACRADGITAQRAARADLPPTGAEPRGWHPRRTQGLSALPTTPHAPARPQGWTMPEAECYAAGEGRRGRGQVMLPCSVRGGIVWTISKACRSALSRARLPSYSMMAARSSQRSRHA
jgi:hypothetical protein